MYDLAQSGGLAARFPALQQLDLDVAGAPTPAQGDEPVILVFHSCATNLNAS